MSLSVKDFEALREELAQVISKFTKRVSDSSAEIPACLNIDFFKY